MRRFYTIERLYNYGNDLVCLMNFDLTLIDKMKRGEQHAFSTCYKQLSPAIYSTVLRICHCKTSAQDILQDTFIQAFNSLNTLEDNDKFVAWCKKISYHKTINWIRNNEKHLHVLDLDSVQEPLNNSDLQTHLELEHQLTTLMLHVSPQARLILWLYVVEGYNHHEIAKLYDKSVSFSKSIVARTLSILKTKSKEKSRESI